MRGNDVVILRYEKADKFGIHSKTETFLSGCGCPLLFKVM
jgi:hypothetical protein